MRAGSGAEPGVRRRRRTPEEAETEIIGAAEALLRERPFRELTVDEVMRRTELSRPSFYVYFRDRHHLVLKVVETIESTLMEMAERWYKGGGDGPSEIRAAVEGVVEAFAAHGPVLKALSDAAADDSEVEVVYSGLVQRFIDTTREQIEKEVAAGRALPCDPGETAKAIVWMYERYLLQTLGSPPCDVPPQRIVDTLVTIQTRTVYGTA